MRITLWSIVACFAILLGCSTAGKNSAYSPAQFRPPEVAYWPLQAELNQTKDFDSVDLYLNRLAKNYPDTVTSWWVDFKRAQLWSKVNKNIACENFSKLASQPEFPIHQVAYLYAHEVCPKENQVLERLASFDLNLIDPWLSKKALDVAIIKAEQKKDKIVLIDLYTKKSKNLLIKEEKIEFTEKAYQLALKLNRKEKINELRNRLYYLAPSKNTNPLRKDYLAIANDLRSQRKFDDAIDIYKKIYNHRKSNPNEKLQALRGIRAIYKIQQNKELSLAATEQIAQFTLRLFKKSAKTTNDANLLNDSFLLLARTYWTEQDNAKAHTLLDQLTRYIQNRTSLAEVYWMRGRMEEEAQNFTAAVSWFKKALDERIDSPNFRAKIQWYLAWNYRKTKQYDLAAKLFNQLILNTNNKYEKSRMQFWLAKTEKQVENEDEYQDLLEDIISEQPLSFYGLLAHRELNRPIPLKLIKTPEPVFVKGRYQMTKQLHTLIDENYLSWLIVTNENEMAAQYLDNISAQLKKTSSEDIDSWAQLLQMYSDSHNYLAMFDQLNQLSENVRRSVLEMNAKLIFPNPYFETVAQSAGRFGISPEFIYSIMRQESSFNPLARSHMDAFGLMQLLPEVAKKSAEANDINYVQAEDLFSPHINIPIGSAHLRELWDKYNGEIILAAASYNASEKAILNWLNTRFRGDTLEFIEDIPYDETRDYVKLVLRNFVNYQILAAQEDRFSFPEWTLKVSADRNPPQQNP